MPTKSEINHAKKIFNLLKSEYPAVEIALNFNDQFQLLISTILSAQCTDERVNMVGKTLYKKYKKPEDFVNVQIEELEKDIYSTGFYHNKAKNIKKCCKELIDKHNGKVPADFEALCNLPGVGRKTASVVIGNGFGIPAIAVDTHVTRLSNLLGFIKSKDAVKIEFKLKELLPEEDWINASHFLATHGRNICIANRPKCLECVLGNLCPSFKASV